MKTATNSKTKNQSKPSKTPKKPSIRPNRRGKTMVVKFLESRGLSFDPNNRNVILGETRGFFREVYSVTVTPDEKLGGFGMGVRQLFYGLSCLMSDDDEEGYHHAFVLIKEAGETIYAADGDKGLRDTMLWIFLPKDWHNIIDRAWDGIGEWKY